MNKNLKDIKDPGFKLPDNYFESLEDAVLDKIKAEKIKSVAEEPGFRIPDKYFESVEDQVFEKLNSETKVVSINKYKKLYYISGIAASIVLLFGIFYFNQPKTENSELDPVVVQQYLLNQNLDSYELASLLTEDELEQMQLEIMDDFIEDESLEDYLIENVNLEEIIEQ